MLSQPSVIARLMGMEDAPPPPPPPPPTTTLLLVKPPSSNSNTPRMEDPHSHSRHGNGDRYCSASHHCLSKAKINLRPPRHHRRRRHPQEELLRKIRDDFQAWQRKSMSKPLLLEEDGRRPGKSSGGRGKLGLDHARYDVQMIARENLRREKMARFGYGGGKTETAQVEEVPVKNAAAAERHGDSDVNGGPEHGCHGTIVPAEKLRGGAPATTRIAILRPTGIQHGQAVFGTSSKAKRDVGMEEFLQEVKERLKREMTVVIGPGSDDGHTKPPPQQQRTAGRRAMARQIRETIMAKVGVGKRLYARSESFRVFRGDRKRAAATAKSPEHRMLKSVIVPPRIGTLSSPKRTRKGLMECLSGRTGLDDRQISCTGTTGVGAAVASPRVLVRSFSAPASSGISQALIGDTCYEGAEVTRRSSSFSFLRGTAVPLPSLGRSFSLGGKLLMMMQFSKNTKPFSSPQQSSNGRADSLSESSPKCSSELDARTSDESSSCCKSSAAADDPDTVHASEVLVNAAGPCDGDGGWSSSSDDMSIARTDSLVLLPIIGDDVVDEESCYYDDKNAGEEEEDDDDAKEHRRRHRRMLSDLANEVALLQAATGSSRASMRRWDDGGAVLSSSEEDEVTTGNAASTVDDVVEREVMRSPWLTAAQLQEEVNVVVGKMERAIFGQLVAEVARELFA